MQSKEMLMTVWCMMLWCGVVLMLMLMLMPGLLEAMEGEPCACGFSPLSLWRFNFFFFVGFLQSRTSRFWWISIMDWMIGDLWCGIQLRICAGRRESTATGMIG